MAVGRLARNLQIYNVVTHFGKRGRAVPWTAAGAWMPLGIDARRALTACLASKSYPCRLGSVRRWALADELRAYDPTASSVNIKT